MHPESFSLIVRDDDEAISLCVTRLGFELVEDSPTPTSPKGSSKRWALFRPPGARTGVLLAHADSDEQRAAVGNQHADRVGLFLHVEDFDEARARMHSLGVVFDGEPREEPYGQGGDLLRRFREPLGPAGATRPYVTHG